MRNSSELEQQSAVQIAGFMAAAARTAPKTRGIDNIKWLAFNDEGSEQRLISNLPAGPAHAGADAGWLDGVVLAINPPGILLPLLFGLVKAFAPGLNLVNEQL